MQSVYLKIQTRSCHCSTLTLLANSALAPRPVWLAPAHLSLLFSALHVPGPPPASPAPPRCQGLTCSCPTFLPCSSFLQALFSCVLPFSRVNILFFFFFWPHGAACGILVPRPGIKPVPPALEAQSLNHWTAREVLSVVFLKDRPGTSVVVQWLRVLLPMQGTRA